MYQDNIFRFFCTSSVRTLHYGFQALVKKNEVYTNTGLQRDHHGFVKTPDRARAIMTPARDSYGVM